MEESIGEADKKAFIRVLLKNYLWRRIGLVLIVGIIMRYGIMCSNYQATIESRVEVSTPLNTWKRIMEGIYLQQRNISPYEGDLLHETPIALWFYKLLIKAPVPIDIIFISFDIFTAMLMYLVAQEYLIQTFALEFINMKVFKNRNTVSLLDYKHLINAPIYTFAAYLLNPYTMLSCVGHSTTVFYNTFLTLFVLTVLKGSFLLSTLTLSICTVLAVYPAICIVILVCHFYSVYNRQLAALGVVMFLGKLLALHNISVLLNGSDNFVRPCYLFVLQVTDLQPNIGLFWYFFTEMFDHFRDLFIWSFQINVTILYLIPFAIKFRQQPFLLFFSLTFLTATFKSYPSVGDIGYVLSLIPCFMHLLKYIQQGFLVGVTYFITFTLGPMLHYLWIYTNSANANFYFGVSLAFAIGNIFCITDILFALVKRDYILRYGFTKKIGGKPTMLILE